MKATIFAAIAILGLAAGGTAMAERAQSPQVKLAVGNHPQAETNEHGTQLAAGNHPQAETNERATQLAASGLDYVRRSHRQYA